MKSYIECVDLSASIDQYLVLKKVNVKIESKKIYAVIGENGSGKSTFAQLLCGHKQPNGGKIIIDGKEVDLDSTKTALTHGIYMVHQTPNLLGELSVTENVYLNLMGSNKTSIFINYGKMRKRTKEVFDWIGVEIDVDSKIKTLKYFERQMVELAKAIICEPDLLILDEPTCSMIDNNTEIYINAIKRLKEIGTTIIFISHRISIINRLADKIFIVKDKTINNYTHKSISEEILLKEMIEDRVLKRYPKVNFAKEEVLFELRNLTSESGSIENINLTVKKGEIVGVTGLYGAGKTSIGNTMFGLEKHISGEVFLNGKSIPIGLSNVCIENGIGYIHENIKRSLVQNQSVSDNIVLANLKTFKNNYKLNREITARTLPYIQCLNLKKIRDYKSVSSYSVGSQQKIVFAKWLFANVNLVIMDEPTKNVDVISKIELYNLMTHMVKKEKGILFLSSDIDELIGMCDTILIMYEGKIVKKLIAKKTTHEEILYYSMGKDKPTK
jgi:ribose transport system ATP-binding protein